MKARGGKVVVSLGKCGTKEFSGRKAAREWIMEGLFGCDGAERDHYVSMLGQLEAGRSNLDYWEA